MRQAWNLLPQDEVVATYKTLRGTLIPNGIQFEDKFNSLRKFYISLTLSS